MAENESLDLGTPGARRWHAVFAAVRNGEPAEEVANLVSRKLHGGLRKAFKELTEKGIALDKLLAARDSPETLRQLVKQCKGHAYAQLFSATAVAERGTSTEDVLADFIDAVWQVVGDQIAMHVAGTDRWPTLVDVELFSNQVRELIQPDVLRIAHKLAEDPTWLPKRVGKKGLKGDPTTEMLPMSLLGVEKK